ncbi:MAG: hypothetical protein ACI9CA_000283 [Natronomonas sp.]
MSTPPRAVCRGHHRRRAAAHRRPAAPVAVQGVGGLGRLGSQYARAGGLGTGAVSTSPDKGASAGGAPVTAGTHRAPWSSAPSVELFRGWRPFDSRRRRPPTSARSPARCGFGRWLYPDAGGVTRAPVGPAGPASGAQPSPSATTNAPASTATCNSFSPARVSPVQSILNDWGAGDYIHGDGCGRPCRGATVCGEGITVPRVEECGRAPNHQSLRPGVSWVEVYAGMPELRCLCNRRLRTCVHTEWRREAAGLSPV